MKKERSKREPIQITVSVTFTDPVNGPRRAIEALLRSQLYPLENRLHVKQQPPPES